MERRLGTFIDAVTVPQVREALELVTTGPVIQISRDEMLRVVTYDNLSLERMAPKWLNTRGMVSLGEVMNNAEFWYVLLTQQSDPIQADVRYSVGHFSDEQAAKGIEGANYQFARRAVALNLLASAMGEEFGEDIGSRGIRLPVYSGFKSAKAMSKIYPTPAANPQELYERWLEIFPAPNLPPGKSDLFTLLVDNDEFYKDQNDQKSACPAPPIVKTIFQEYGRLLRSQAYKETFMDIVTNKPGDNATING